MVVEVAEELPRQRSQPFRYLSLRFSRLPQVRGQGKAGGPAALGSGEQESRRAAWMSTFYASFWPLVPCSAGAQATGAYPHLAKESPKGMRFITHIRHAAGVSYKSIRLLAGPTAGTQAVGFSCHREIFCHETKSNVNCWPSTHPIRSHNSIYRSGSKTPPACSAIKGVTQPRSERETKEDILKANTSTQVPSFHQGTVRVRLQHCRGFSKAQVAVSLPNYNFSL
ncbi:uncharacterized protein ACIBXB_014608 [Morphnus guianensis]